MEKESNANYFILLIILILITIAIITAALMFIDNSDGKVSPSHERGAISNVSITENLPSVSDCGVTIATKEGPYYLSDTKELINGELNYKNLTGDKIKISGYVYSGSTSKIPIANAKIEIWQADEEGIYHPNGNGFYSDYSEDDIALRGFIKTDNNGYYTFNSIYPGYYEGRARHIHVKVTADDYQGLTSQIIFMPKPGDGVIYSTDTIAQTLPECNLLTLTKEGEFEVGNFNIRLENE